MACNDGETARPQVGLAYNKYVPGFLRDHPGEIDYVEVPYELLAHDPTVAEIGKFTPIILHCASLSMGGSLRCPEPTLSEIAQWVLRTGTPWLGEHLAFITAHREALEGRADEYAPGEPYNIGYTVSPPMNEGTVKRVIDNLAYYGPRFPVPILLENSPLYFRLPGSTMTQPEFLTEICHRTEAGLLLDLAHFCITAQTLNFDAEQVAEELPLERVVEIHISGIDEQEDASWDNHAARAPEVVFQLLDHVLERAPARAVTLEYNWSSAFPRSILLEEVARTRELIARRIPA